MSQGMRPGGLTALAVLNFIFGGLNVVGALGWAVFITLLYVELPAGTQGATLEQQEKIRALGLAPLLVALAASAVCGVLQLASGIGYMRQKKFLGRFVGNTAAAATIAASIATATLIPDPELGGGFNLNMFANLVYPVLTVVVINTTFREDFVN